MLDSLSITHVYSVRLTRVPRPEGFACYADRLLKRNPSGLLNNYENRTKAATL